MQRTNPRGVRNEAPSHACFRHCVAREYRPRRWCRRRHGHGHGHGQLYAFSGEVLTAPGPNASSLSVQVETGNKAALKALIGASQNEVFSLGSGTRVMIWSHGVPHVGTTADLQQGDWVTVRVRAAHGSSLQQIESQQAAAVAESAAPNGGRPLWLLSAPSPGRSPAATSRCT